jgi:hypothetical protein
LSVVVRIQVLFLGASASLRSRRKFQCRSKGARQVVHDHTRVMCLQEGHEIERAVLDLG